ncbi:D-alanyl-D-alanine endopeptidase [Variovorax dokdonensis]|uniref:D-alanyl-D-alanine endopeptidase n=1 Tax=Variovorax dokdonensis TaxID=344883 RepID=A0ABT7NCA1_9BURK|nr:D-alanyl-D-alanine endopeptidase [Variovorax dokdonensis]MDM0045581.1 D-alanyl-D-alanine endopeptidase [Variovorax dokdonensis]
MSETRPGRVSSQRLLPGWRNLAVAFCATAFLLSGVHAASSKKDVRAKTSASASKSSSASSKPSKSTKTASSKRAVSKQTAKADRTSAKSSSRVSVTYSKSAGSRSVTKQRVIARTYEPSRQSFGQMAGLHGADDALDLRSSVALVVDQDTHEVLFSKNEQAVLPIASITKLMTGVLISEAHLPGDELITITQDDVDTEKHSSSRLRVGSTLPRSEMLHLALMSSENRAAHALGRTYPGGLSTFVAMMNAKARSLGMHDTRYVEPTGLSSSNQSSARDLAVLVNYAYGDPLLREYSTSPERQVEVGSRVLQFNTTNRLVKSPEWEIGLQKTGYISEAGQCLVMQARIAGRKLIMVFLDGVGRYSRIADAERVRRWVEANQYMSPAASPALTPVDSNANRQTSIRTIDFAS